ncbi:Resolvase, N terminal domain (plasmid) [Bergeyella porcorum]|uniref:Resolvase, N terminal domain n=1 Tax=Bergeyella porcorum TaxID=1735111 RepID=A0AAU0F6A8_9FLAO
MVELIDLFNQKGVLFKSISEPAFDTTSANGKFIIQIFGAVAEFERNLISERNQNWLGGSEAKK